MKLGIPPSNPIYSPGILDIKPLLAEAGLVADSIMNVVVATLKHTARIIQSL
tara:strand:- start:324 stop:479 length:156 start_codon:yes stop_codon:yes gene_type:complete